MCDGAEENQAHRSDSYDRSVQVQPFPYFRSALSSLGIFASNME